MQRGARTELTLACYNGFVATREELIAYKERWKAVEEIELRKLREASIAQKWQQLNAIVALAIRLGIFTSDPSEEEVYLRWGSLKEKEIKKQLPINVRTF